MGNYVVLHLKNVSAEQYESVCSRLFDDGAEGVSESLKFIQESQQYEPEIIPEDLKNIEAYFSPQNLDLDKLKISYSDFSPLLKEEEAKDWLSEWKKHYKPFKVMDTLWIYPSWIEPEDKNKKVIKIDPGLAFGTGTHATTLLCMRKIEELFNEKPLNSVLDVGAGTGILSLLCFKNGFKDIYAVEIDEMAREKCRENFEINGFKTGYVLSPEETDYQRTYDVVVANIIDGVLLKIKEDLMRATGRELILSGILRENEEEVKREFSEKGFNLVSTHHLEEWCLLHFTRSN